MRIGRFERIRRIENTGIVDQHVEPAERAHRGRDQLVAGAGLAQIGAMKLGPHAGLLQIFEHRAAALDIAAGKHDGSPRFRERPSAGLADASG